MTGMLAVKANSRGLVSVIIVTWNCRDYALQCLRTIEQTVKIPLEVIVRDNGSEDGTVPAIQKNHPAVKLIGDGRNVGFAAANNEAIQHAVGRYLLLLNPDTEILPTTIAALVEIAQAYGDRALAVPMLLNSDGTIQPSWHSFPTVRGAVRKGLTLAKASFRKHPPHAHEREVDWAIGACWLLPRAVHEVIGKLDARLFMYGEDLDYCWRVRRAGFKIIGVPALQVVHHGNVSGTQKWGDQRLAKTNQGLIYFWMKHFGAYYLAIMVPIRLTYHLGQAMYEFLQSLLQPAGVSRARARQQLSQASALLRACLDRGAWGFYCSARKSRPDSHGTQYF